MALKLRLLEAELASTHEQLTCQEESLMELRELLQQRTLKLEQLHDQYAYIQVCTCLGDNRRVSLESVRWQHFSASQLCLLYLWPAKGIKSRTTSLCSCDTSNPMLIGYWHDHDLKKCHKLTISVWQASIVATVRDTWSLVSSSVNMTHYDTTLTTWHDSHHMPLQEGDLSSHEKTISLYDISWSPHVMTRDIMTFLTSIVM